MNKKTFTAIMDQAIKFQDEGNSEFSCLNLKEAESVILKKSYYLCGDLRFLYEDMFGIKHGRWTVGDVVPVGHQQVRLLMLSLFKEVLLTEDTLKDL